MMVTVKLFGTLRLDTGVKELTADADSIRSLCPLAVREIRRQNPLCGITEKDLKACLVSVNGTQVSPGARLRDGDIVSFFPPAAGG